MHSYGFESTTNEAYSILKVDWIDRDLIDSSYRCHKSMEVGIQVY